MNAIEFTDVTVIRMHRPFSAAFVNNVLTVKIVIIFSIQRCTKQNIIKRFKLYTYYYISEYLFLFVLHEMYRVYVSKYTNT